MKGIRTLAASSILVLFAIVSLPAFAKDDERATTSEYCASRNDLGLSHGACVAYLETHNIVPHDASVCRSEGIQGFLGVTNPGQCVKKLGEMRRRD